MASYMVWQTNASNKLEKHSPEIQMIDNKNVQTLLMYRNVDWIISTNAELTLINLNVLLLVVAPFFSRSVQLEIFYTKFDAHISSFCVCFVNRFYSLRFHYYN